MHSQQELATQTGNIPPLLTSGRLKDTFSQPTNTHSHPFGQTLLQVSSASFKKG